MVLQGTVEERLQEVQARSDAWFPAPSPSRKSGQQGSKSWKCCFTLKFFSLQLMKLGTHAPEGLACTCREAPFWKILAFQQVLLQIILSLNLIVSNNSAWCLTIYRQIFLSQITIQGSRDNRKFNPWPVTAGFWQEKGAPRYYIDTGLSSSTKNSRKGR